jgi:hypothetical protein
MTDIQKIFDLDPRIDSVREYPDGFVARAYRWPAPGTAIETYRDGTRHEVVYDRKRPHGRGPNWVARSAKGGTLRSG